MWAGSPSFDAYQSRYPDRVKKQMAALYEAIAELGIVYCSPPASYELSSHVTEMMERIANQVRVLRCGSGTSRIEVV